MDDIRGALESHLGTLSNVLPTEYELVSFTPDNDTPYQSAHLSDIITVDMSLSFDNRQQYLGFFQVNLKYPIGQGVGAMVTEALRIIAHYERGLVLTKDDIEVRILETPTRSKVSVDNDRGIMAVRINFQAYNNIV
ncbi:MAG: hypothetical protein GQ570_11770 [Helicobacteraceae bacterium]|nr:hypothetical protein [Helicobacteraceae bacterium]